MANSIKDALTAIADAIRKRTGKTGKMNVADMPAEIASIPAGGHDKEIIEGTITDYKNDEVTKVRDYAFSDCNNLTSVYLPATTEVGRNAFTNCRDLVSADLPAATKINDEAFRQCLHLASVDLTAATTIGGYALYNCYSLASVNLPAVTKIGSWAFKSCRNLASVKIGGKNPEVCTLEGSGTFSYTEIDSGTGFIYVPDALVDAYKTATNWAQYANQIKPLSEAPTT